MPKTKREEFIFTAMTSGLMIFIMGVYNVAINNNGLEYASFVQAARTFPLEWLIGFLLAFFVANKLSLIHIASMPPFCIFFANAEKAGCAPPKTVQKRISL